ncbi:MAG: DUF4126 domain-containing protein [Anaerolineales bacterium]|nr:DUF4126 domain-containing protein [Anaerolineales bacterium]MCW5855697.1 DUF4126 domain-containing protein [Anaerolineales bacterium]MCW5877958.1 DUF4126 domain-containing protein [Anaerolineales bacterium]
MIEILTNIGTAFGLSSSAGLNAYLPLLIVALTAKYTTLIKLNQPWDLMTNWWVIGVLAVLVVIEITVDKIPAVDTVNDVLQSVGRPAAGAILFASSSGAVGELHPILALIAGLFLAGGVHAVKTAARPAVTASTLGTGNWLVSLVEDVVVLVSAILAILVPLVIVLLVIFMFLAFLWWKNRPFKPQATA